MLRLESSMEATRGTNVEIYDPTHGKDGDRIKSPWRDCFTAQSPPSFDLQV